MFVRGWSFLPASEAKGSTQRRLPLVQEEAAGAVPEGRVAGAVLEVAAAAVLEGRLGGLQQSRDPNDQQLLPH